MKIALYSGTYVRDKDGAVKSIYRLVASFRKKGHQVEVWSPDVSMQDDHDGVTVHTMPAVPIPLYPDYKLGFFRSATKRQLDSFVPDIVHISTPDIVGREFLLYAKANSIPVASAFHTDFPAYLSYYRLAFAEPAAWKYLSWFYNSCNLVFAPNGHVRKKLAAHNIRNVEIWSRGVDRQFFNPSRRSESLRARWNVQDRKVIVYTGRFVPYKATEIVMSVYDRFMAMGSGSCVRFVMIGSGPQEGELRRLMPEAVFTGYLTGTELAEAYASGDIFLFPSTTEAFCNVALEALASGMPAVVSDEGGCCDIVERSGAGVVARAGDADEFFARCLELSHDADRYTELRSRGLAYAGDQSWCEVNGTLIDRYDGLVSQLQGCGA
ncbi:MAG: glycosyltransferase family 1 protein [Chlorobiaceae bacterium]